MEQEVLKITKNLRGKDLLLVLMNIFNLGYGELYIGGNLQNLLGVEVRPFWKIFIKDVKVHLLVDKPTMLPMELLNYDISSIIFSTRCKEIKDYIQTVHPFITIGENAKA